MSAGPREPLEPGAGADVRRPGTLDAVDVRVLFFDGCPNWGTAQAVVRQALGKPGLTTTRRPHRGGEPSGGGAAVLSRVTTVLLDGEEPFARLEAPVGLMCRVHRTRNGTGGVPTVEQLTSASFRSRI